MGRKSFAIVGPLTLGNSAMNVDFHCGGSQLVERSDELPRQNHPSLLSSMTQLIHIKSLDLSLFACGHAHVENCMLYTVCTDNN